MNGRGAPRPRVVVLLNNPFVADSRSWKLARGLARAGADVTVVAREAAGLPEREERDGVVVIRVAQPRPLARLPVPGLPDARSADGRPTGRPLARVARAASQQVTSSAGRLLQAVRFQLLPGRWATAIAGAVPPAAVWQSEGLVCLPVALELRRRLGGRVVYDVRDVTVESARLARLPGPWRRLLARRERSWARAADATIAANVPYAEVLERRYRVHATVVFNGPELDADTRPPTGAAGRASIRERLEIAAATPVVLYLGNVAPERGVEQLCRAMTDVPGAQLLVVGPGGRYRDDLIAQVRTLPASDRIRFLPGVAPAEIPAWTAVGDVAAMPIQPTTLNHRLTTPTRLFDAMGVGVPVVASDLPGMAAIVRETGCGVLCDPTDPADVARAIRSILDARPERRAAFGAAGLAAAHGGYAWERQMAALLGVYERLGIGLADG